MEAMTSATLTAAIRPYKQQLRRKGVTITCDAVTVNNQVFLVTGRFMRTAALLHYVEEDLTRPDVIVRQLKKATVRVDILKFWQRVPDTTPKYSHFHEFRDVAVVPVTTHKHWFEKQISQTARNKIRKAAKGGISIREEPLSDELVRGVMAINDESPTRRGKPYWHYRKDFDTVKKELSDDPEKSIFVTAYDGEELIGFIKLLLEDRFLRTTLVLDKMSRRGNAPSPMNSLFSKAVEVCEQRRIPYFVYSVWRRGDHGHFQQSNGFVKMPVPEYFVPLTMRGRLALALGLHNGIKARIPERMMINLLNLRARWYTLRFRT